LTDVSGYGLSWKSPKIKTTIKNNWDTFGGLEGVNNLSVGISSRKLAVFRRGDRWEKFNCKVNENFNQ